MNELMNFDENEVEVFEFEERVLFNPYDVGNCLDLNDVTVRRHMQGMSDKQVVKLTNLDVKDIHFRKLNNAGENFLTENGVLHLITNSTKTSEGKRQELFNFLKVRGLLSDNKIVKTRKEVEFFHILSSVVEPFELTLEVQKRVLNYRVDGYIPELNIAVEYDEGHHAQSIEKDADRQKEIERELGCKFIRLSDKDSDYFNVGLLMRFIFKECAGSFRVTS